MSQFNVTLPWEGAPDSIELADKVQGVPLYYDGDDGKRREIGTVLSFVSRTDVSVVVSAEISDPNFRMLNADWFRLGRPTPPVVPDNELGGFSSPSVVSDGRAEF